MMASRWMAAAALGVCMLASAQAVFTGVREGWLEPHIGAVFPLTEAAAALERAGLPASVRVYDLRHTVATLLLSALTLVGWWLARGAAPAIANTVAVLVVACPCALALAHPLGSLGLALDADMSTTDAWEMPIEAS